MISVVEFIFNNFPFLYQLFTEDIYEYLMMNDKYDLIKILINQNHNPILFKIVFKKCVFDSIQEDKEECFDILMDYGFIIVLNCLIDKSFFVHIFEFALIKYTEKIIERA